jgi:uncharacterized protein (DUF927 family)
MDSAMFAPLSEAEIAIAGTVPAEGGWRAIMPVPPDAPRETPPNRRGAASGSWAYRNASGELLGRIVRFETANGGKNILPLTFCEGQNDKREWRWQAFPAPRPLYGLDRLAARPDASVLIVEGEKAADAAEKRFPDCVAVTSPGGSGVARHADWSSLANRNVKIWPDNDAPGAGYAKDVAQAALAAGAAAVAIVDVPPEFSARWDLADPLPADWSEDDLRRLLDAARPLAPEPKVSMPAGFSMRADGLYWQDPGDPDKPAQMLSGPFEVLAETRDADGNSWGVLIRWPDHDGRPHEWALPRAMLAGDGADARRVLLDGGLYVSPRRGSRDRLTAFLAAVKTDARARAVTRIGWHGRAFVLPNETFGQTEGERVLLQSAAGPEHAFNTSGSLADWQAHIARYAVGNSRLAFAISAAFAPPLLYLVNEESGGINFMGASRTGKTTTLQAAGSVWGGGGVGGFIRTWRATDNGLEGIAERHCDALLCLDEMGQIDPRSVGEIAYMLANGEGKSRARRDGTGRKPAQWRLLFLSTGELSLADKMAEVGKRPKAGQEVRLVDVPADAGTDMGVFEQLHGKASPEVFARHLKEAAARYYGEASQAFLRKLTELPSDEIAAAVSRAQGEFLAKHVPAGASGQVHSVAGRFALVAAAGTLATAFGILPWPQDEASRAASACFAAWLDRRGGAGVAEIEKGLAQIRRFLEAHGMTRFEPMGADLAGEVRINNRVGFRRRDKSDRWEYFVLPEAFKTDLCTGLDTRLMAREMIARGFMLPDKRDGKPQAREYLPGLRSKRCYHITGAFMEDEAEGGGHV